MVLVPLFNRMDAFYFGNNNKIKEVLSVLHAVSEPCISQSYHHIIALNTGKILATTVKRLVSANSP